MKRLFYGAIREDVCEGVPVEGYYDTLEEAWADFSILGEVMFVFDAEDDRKRRELQALEEDYRRG